jgi:hypothetical protein
LITPDFSANVDLGLEQDNVNGTLHSALDGALAGAAATLPMSAVMAAADSAGLMGKQPPEVIVEKGMHRSGIHASEPAEDTVTLAAHFGFGAAAGALFGLLNRGVAHRRSIWVAEGIAFGLVVYAVSYKGWIPALNILPQPEHDRPGRQPSMIAAHVVFGAALGALLSRRK